MNKSKNLSMLLSLMESITGYDYTNQMVTLDSEVNDCLIYMYFYMISSDEKYYQEFHEKYIKLNDEQKEVVKNDYINI